jgi:hypothetical protein
LNPYSVAVGDLVMAAAPDRAATALILQMIGRVSPDTFIVLADLVREPRGRRCACGNGAHLP